MKKIYQLLALITLLVSGCSQDEVIKNQDSSSKSLIYTASFEGNESRTYLNEDGYLRWTAGDQISIFGANTYNQQYKFTGETGANSGTFEKVSGSYATGTDLNNHYALYPYNSLTRISETGVITATIPANQTYAVNSFGLGDNTMVAVTADKNDTFLKFKNVGGYLELKLYGDNVTVKSIKLEGNSDEKLAGNATITSIYGQDPTISMANDATKTITMDCGDSGVQLGTTSETATTFLLVVPPTTFASGFTITVTDINGGEFTKSTSKSIEIKRNIIQPMNAFEVEIQNDDISYLTFSANATQTLTMSKAVATLEYSVNNSEWTTLGTTTVSFGGELGNLRLRGESSIGTAISTTDYSNIIFGEHEMVTCSGDIRTLVDYENYENANTSNAKFCWLFSGCEYLTTAPDLPAKTLAECSYTCMFYYCTNLTETPELPATTLTERCYTSMFSGCSSLKYAPELPATKLAKGCYSQMFYDCTSLISAPQLPALTLAESCYSSMFERCNKLVTAPELPATTLAEYCYNCMFRDCSSLINIPELPVMALEKACYQSMFSRCSSLTKVPQLPATSLAELCYCGMFFNCTNLEKAPELPATTLAKECYYIMFSGCSKLNAAPELPAKTLAWGCYGRMFYNCTSLITSPELHAEILTECCYNEMFSGCNNLNKVTMLAKDISADRCLNAWLQDVSSTGILNKHKDMGTLPKGSSGIPYGWSVKNNGE